MLLYKKTARLITQQNLHRRRSTLISCINTDYGVIVFRGKVNPASPIGNNPHDSKALTMLAKTDHFVCPYSDHSGKVIEVSTEDSGAIIDPGDAFIIHPESPIKTGFIRTRDCVPTLGFLGPYYFGIHSSNITEFGWRKPNNNGFVPISKKVLNRIAELSGENLDRCEIHIGPCIAGLQGNGCDCYGYTETTQQPDGTSLIKLIQEHYPKINLEGLFFRDYAHDKIFFRWGVLFVEMFKSLGIPEENIHTGYNYCTNCNDGWWSARREPDSPSNLALIMR